MKLTALDKYGMVNMEFPKKSKAVYDPSLWNALRSKKKNSRQKRLIKKVERSI